MKPPPPRLPACGCVTASAKPTATAASTALPPPLSTSTPTRAARASWATTMPWRATTAPSCARTTPSGIRTTASCARTDAFARSRNARTARSIKHSTLRRCCFVSASPRLHGPPRHRLQELLQLTLPELRHAGGAVATRIIAGRNQEKATVLHALERALHQSRFRGIAFVIGGIDRQQRRLDALEARRGIIVARGFPLVEEVVGIGGKRGCQSGVEQLVCRLTRRGRLLIGQRSAIGGDAEEHIGGTQRARLRRVITVVPLRVVADGIDQ